MKAGSIAALLVAPLLFCSTTLGQTVFDVAGFEGLTLQVQRHGEAVFVHEDSAIVPEFRGTIGLHQGLVLLATRGGTERLGVVRDDVVHLDRGARGRRRMLVGRKVSYDHGVRGEVISLHLGDSLVDIPVENTEERCTTLLPKVSACPNQQGAGSCLYMALTGAAEMALANEFPQLVNTHDGDIDLSERFLMNIGAIHGEAIANWRTDSILAFNLEGGALRNRDYRFTKGWYLDDDASGDSPGGGPFPAEEGQEGAQYGCYYNWINEYDEALKEKLVAVPTFDRQVVFQDENNDQWSTGHMNDSHVELVKTILGELERPVLIVYNHFAYWHAVLIVGFDETRPTDDALIERWATYILEKAQKFEESGDPKLIKRAKRYRAYVKAARENVEASGGSSGKGVFFVRDSIYGGPEDDVYDYDTTKEGEEAPYALPIIERDYTWLKHLSNHVVKILY